MRRVQQLVALMVVSVAPGLGFIRGTSAPANVPAQGLSWDTQVHTLVGVWDVPTEQVRRVNAGKQAQFLSLPPWPFRFDGQYITLYLLTRRPDREWHSEDDYYRVKAKWVGNDLYYLPPFWDWVYLATFVNGRFQNKGWVFERVKKPSLHEKYRPLLLPREPHDYNTRRLWWEEARRRLGLPVED